MDMIIIHNFKCRLLTSAPSVEFVQINLLRSTQPGLFLTRRDSLLKPFEVAQQWKPDKVNCAHNVRESSLPPCHGGSDLRLQTAPTVVVILVHRALGRHWLHLTLYTL